MTLSDSTILPTAAGGRRRDEELRRFAEYLRQLQSQSPYQWSSRGWAYVLENQGVVTKAEFDRVENLINECRKKGILPIDFTAPDDSRAFEGLETPTVDSVTEHFQRLVKTILDGGGYTPDWWKGEEYYIEMLVEKKDLKTIFQPICEKYHIPVANSRGSSDINTRAAMAKRFQHAENMGLTPVLMVCGDHDPYGFAITEFLEKNFKDIALGTGWLPDNLVVDRFGLNLDFIEANNLTRIDNLISGGDPPRDMSRDYGRNRIVTSYMDKFRSYNNGVWKCEANAIVVAHQAGVRLCTNAIERWLGRDAKARFAKKEDEVRRQIKEFLEKHKGDKAFERVSNAETVPKEKDQDIKKCDACDKPFKAFDCDTCVIRVDMVCPSCHREDNPYHDEDRKEGEI